MQMDFKLLEAFRTVMENSSVTRAAAVLRVTQPAVSAQIARLEALIGFDLFERTGGRLRPTPEGRQFYAEALHTLGMIDRLEQVSTTIRSGRSGSLVIASYPVASISILPDLVARFANAHPDVVVRMINRSSEEVRSIFEATAVDIGMAIIPIDIPGIEVRRYMVPTVAIMPRGHPVAAKHVVTPADLSGLPFVSASQSRLIGHRIRTAITDAGAEFRMVAECEYFSSICAMVAGGLGVSVVDCWSAYTFRSHGLEIRPFQPAVESEIGVFFGAEKPPNTLTREFLDLIDNKLKSPPTFEAAVR